MKKTILLIILAFTFSKTFCQNWQAVMSNRTALFNLSGNVMGIRIDSVSLSGSDSLFFNFRSINDESLLQIPLYPGSICEMDTSWIGAGIIIQSNGNNIFLTESLDSLTIKTSANLNDTWVMYRFSNGNYFEATISASSIDTVLGMPDSVKVISLQLRDSLGNSMASVMNGNRFSISKNYGLTRLVPLRHFPLNVQNCTLVGLDNPVSGMQNLTAPEIFDFNVGDIFQYYNKFSTLNTVQIWNIQHTILSKSYSLNNDSVIYLVDDSTWQEIDYMGVSYYLSHTISTETYPIQPIQYENHFFVLPRELGQAIFDGICISEQSTSSNYNNRISKTIFENVSIYGFNEPCFSYNFSSTEYICYTNQETYVSGLGKVWSQNVNPFATRICIWHMSYFKKGNETWGTPVNLSQLVSSSEFEIKQVKISQNPFTTSLQIENMPSSAKWVELMDSRGRLVFRSDNFNSNYININTGALSNGLYFLTIGGGREPFHFKLIRQ